MEKVFVVTKHLVVYTYGYETKVNQYVLAAYKNLESAMYYVEETTHNWLKDEIKTAEGDPFLMTYTSPKEPSETEEGKEYAHQYVIEPTLFEEH